MRVYSDILDGKHRIHFIGIGGSGMFPLAQILQKQGYMITGSDNNPGDTIEEERSMGMQVVIGQKAENVKGADAIVYSAAIMEDNPELAAARHLGVPVLERAELLGLVSSKYDRCIAVSGTHGKTTTTALLTHILLGIGMDPSAIIGGKLPEIGGSGRVGNSDILICEACEFMDTFLHLYPDFAIVLNIDEDHLDYFGNLENIIRSFQEFCDLATTMILYNGDDANTRKALKGIICHKVSFGRGASCDYRAVQPERKGNGWTYDLYKRNRRLCSVTTAIPGEHNVLNSLAAISMAVSLGFDPALVAELAGTFQGAKRRFEILGTKNGVTVADDYAHHPTEIAATLRAAKEMDFRRVWAVHQPFTYSRTALLLDDFAEALSLADQVVLSEIMGAREINSYGISSEDLQKKIPGSVYFPSFPEIAEYVLDHAEEGDLVITLGCGDVYKCAKQIVE